MENITTKTEQTHRDDTESSCFSSFSVEPVYPQKKQQQQYRRRQTWIIVIFIFVLVVVCVAVIIAVTGNAGGGLSRSLPLPPTTTLAPTTTATFRETTVWEILNTLVIVTVITDEDKLNDPNTPEAQALDWILNKDPLQLVPENYVGDYPNRLIQRYLLAYFYFHTSKNGPWISCNPPVGEQLDKLPTCHHEDYHESSGTYRKFLESRWLSRTNECQWAGILCDNDNDDDNDNNSWVVSIWLEGYHLSGSFPFEILKLPHLKWLQMSYNELTGTLPRNIPLENFRMYLNWNSFVGSIPEEWYNANATDLVFLEIEGNHITGSIPSELALITSLEKIRFGSNLMTGTIPTELFSLQLTSVDLSNNTLQGTVPTEVGTCTNLFRYSNDGNLLTGTLPTEFALLTDMEYFTTQFTQMSGTIPEDIWKNWKGLEHFEVESNKFNGTLSSWIGELHKLDTLLLADNAFTGTLPSEIGQLSTLDKATFHLNNFINTSMPDEVCNLRFTPRAKLEELTADCSNDAAAQKDSTEGRPAVHCSAGCCAECCNKDTGTCTNGNDDD